MEVRFGVLSHDEISDRILVINPGYGERIGKYGSRPVQPQPNYIRMMYPFYEDLEASILKDGFRNPIHCLSIDEGTFCKYGTSRLWVAKKHKLDVPCIISDFTGRWEELEQLKSKKKILEKFTDQPDVFEFKKDHLRIDKCPNNPKD